MKSALLNKSFIDTGLVTVFFFFFFFDKFCSPLTLKLIVKRPSVHMWQFLIRLKHLSDIVVFKGLRVLF